MGSSYVRLADVVEFYSGGTPSKKNPDYWDGEIPWVSARSMDADGINDNVLSITDAGLAAGSKLADVGTILLLTRGSGLFTRIPVIWVNSPVAYNQDIKCLKAKNPNDARYIYHWLVSQRNVFSKTLDVTGIGAGKINTDQLQDMVVFWPDVDTRQQMVRVADSLIEAMHLNKRINDYLHDLVMAASKSIYREIEATDEALPDGWRWVEVDEIAELVSRGIVPKYDEGSDEIVLGQTCVRNNLVLIENGRLHKPKKINEKWLREGDLLINSTGVGSLGRTAQVWFKPEKLTVDFHITIVRTRKPEHALYLGFWSFAHERYIESLHTGSTGQTELPRDHVKAIRFVLPDAATLSWFNSIAGPAVKAIVANQDENKKLEALRDALLPKLMSGEIDVSKVKLPA